MNPMNFSQIFSILPDGTGVTQVTTGQQLPTNLAFSDDGRVVAFESVADPFGTNADGSQEVYVINVDGTGHMQLTAAAGNSYTPRISDDGAWIAIASRADLVAGQNADGGLEVFVVSSDGTTTMQVTQTDQDSGAFGSGTPGSLDISGSGTIVAFASSANLTGDNANMTNTLFFAFRDGTGVGQYLRNGTVNANESGRTADNPHLTNDGNGLLFDSSLNFSIDSSGTGEKLYTTIRQ
jgi:Tol biopolymer transport system component